MNPKPRSHVKMINYGHSDVGRSTMLTNCSYSDVVFPCWTLKNEKIKKKTLYAWKIHRLHYISVTLDDKRSQFIFLLTPQS